MNKVQIAGIILLIAGVFISSIFKTIDFGMIPGIIIGFGAGLTVYKRKEKKNN